ncbi:MAG: hypothetical protein GY943_37305 [Chloroflexi bacterium]|nr:hypothetical protein [Chloroflexota bacterium]
MLVGCVSETAVSHTPIPTIPMTLPTEPPIPPRPPLPQPAETAVLAEVALHSTRAETFNEG